MCLSECVFVLTTYKIMVFSLFTKYTYFKLMNYTFIDMKKTCVWLQDLCH